MLLGALRFDFLSYLKKHFFPPLVSSNKQSTPRKFKYSTYKVPEKKSTKLALRVITAKKMIDSTSLRFSEYVCGYARRHVCFF